MYFDYDTIIGQAEVGLGVEYIYNKPDYPSDTPTPPEYEIDTLRIQTLECQASFSFHEQFLIIYLEDLGYEFMVPRSEVMELEDKILEKIDEDAIKEECKEDYQWKLDEHYGDIDD